MMKSVSFLCEEFDDVDAVLDLLPALILARDLPMPSSSARWVVVVDEAPGACPLSPGPPEAAALVAPAGSGLGLFMPDPPLSLSVPSMIGEEKSLPGYLAAVSPEAAVED